MTEHESIQSILALYAAEALGPEEARRVERHAAECQICRQELLAWGSYAAVLPKLPQPAVPAGLLGRTRARMIEQHRAAIARRRENLLLTVLVLIGWAASFAMWLLVRTVTGGSFVVLGANLVSGIGWTVSSTALVWMTAITAAAMLSKRNELRRLYE